MFIFDARTVIKAINKDIDNLADLAMEQSKEINAIQLSINRGEYYDDDDKAILEGGIVFRKAEWGIITGQINKWQAQKAKIANLANVLGNTRKII